MLSRLPPLGIAQLAKRKARKCVICHVGLANPTWNQKACGGKCADAHRLKEQRRRRAAKAFKAERRRIGKIANRKPEIDSPYREWIRTLACCVCILPWRIELTGVAYSNIQKSPTECAHTGPHALGRKSSDYTGIPLCGHAHHREGRDSYHKLSEKPFERKHGIKIAETVAALRAKWAELQGAAA